MAPRRNPPKGAGSSSSSPGQGARKETKHGGNKNGKKEGLSGSSFFTWFMVIALLGVWTSVAVVWFELVDYEEVLGKLGIYDADGDGDFDVEDAKVLLGEAPGGVDKRKAKAKVKEAIKEPLKKIREKEASRKKENKVEEKKKTMEGKVADRKVKKVVEVAKLRKDSDKVKKDKGKENEKSGIDKNVKHKETMKKSAPEKVVTPSQAGKDTVTKKIAKILSGVSENSAKEDEKKKQIGI
ncbi:aspartyl/asparaginyl beta-hydroxylase-like isoform X2 [Mauremys mutica]|uniref:aspartyl/asparaginyl beta-hydroxylase-like isoform X2 n=1 Tax=Mauremys mutica TaxID=74926 RepID=UPI001D161898|nr:aspartyl/asparaginyl beta-hydroxylase-like isoform X2 [Mauremys mutica]